MTREQALKQARKRWGKLAYIRAGEALSSPERRAASDALFREAKTRIEAIDKEVEERLKVTDWYQTLMAERKVMRQQKEAHMWQRLYRKFSVGEQHIGFHVKGEGDTWEEAFEEADDRSSVTKAREMSL